MSTVATKPLPSPSHFRGKLLKNISFALVLLAFSLGGGMAGYHYFCELPWVDSLLNASMILTGMGPVDIIHSATGKIFASFYAIYSGVAFLTIFAVFFSPFLHRFLHKMHLDIEEKD